MKYIQLRNLVQENIFTLLEIKQYFSEKTDDEIRIQLSRFAKRGLITAIKRGIYCFDSTKIDELELANKLYKPSYISVETALNYYGIIPDVVSEVVSVTPTTTKYFSNSWGKYRYLKIKKELFWGYSQVELVGGGFYLLAEKEKALLDYFYFRKIRQIGDLRLDLKGINKKLYIKYANYYPKWIRRIKHE
ncbi:MAG: hypothetical protein Q8P69_01605 [bacterium]|nr:hypothetical protein [bacterium]